MATLGPGPHETSIETRTLIRSEASVPIVHARPDGMPTAGLVLHPDIMGVRPLFDDMATRLASHGFAVAAVEPFARRSEAERAGSDVAARMGWMGSLDDETQLGDLAAAADLLVVEDGVASVGILGFCMGGFYALKAAATERFDRAVSCYGMLRVPENWVGSGQADPLMTAADVCPTLAIFGSGDAFTPAADIDALRAAWADRRDCEIVVVEGAEHGFLHDPDRPAHRADAAAELWPRVLAWLAG